MPIWWKFVCLGKQSLSRLAAHISSLDVFQITLRKGYGIPDLKLDLAALYIKAGLKNMGTMFLLTDAQVWHAFFIFLFVFVRSQFLCYWHNYFLFFSALICVFLASISPLNLDISVHKSHKSVFVFFKSCMLWLW